MGANAEQKSYTVSLNKELFMVLVYLSFGLLAAVVYLIFDDFTMIHILAIACSLSLLINWSAPYFQRATKSKANFDNFNKYYNSQKDDEAWI